MEELNPLSPMPARIRYPRVTTFPPGLCVVEIDAQWLLGGGKALFVHHHFVP